MSHEVNLFYDNNQPFLRRNRNLLVSYFMKWCWCRCRGYTPIKSLLKSSFEMYGRTQSCCVLRWYLGFFGGAWGTPLLFLV